jgi:hypothetical protein
MSADWKKRKYEAGTEVDVQDIHRKPLGIGPAQPR